MIHFKNKNILRGFTIVELVVIIVVIGILASISVVGYGKWRESVAQKEVQSDLQMASSAMENAKNFGSGYPTSIPSTFTSSSSVTITYYAGNSSSYCIDGRSNSNPTVRYFLDSERGKKPTTGTCSGYIDIPGLGEIWIARTSSEANQWYSVTYGNGMFVAVSYSGTNQVMTSPDGITWTARAAAQANGWSSITYGNGLFVAVALSGTNRVMTSPDGITWTVRTAASNDAWNSVTYGNGLFVAVSQYSTNQVMTSPNGITWTARTAAQANQWYSVTYGNGMFVAVAIDGTNRVMTSIDGITWTARTAAQANQWYSVTYGNGMFVAVAIGGTNRVMTSP